MKNEIHLFDQSNGGALMRTEYKEQIEALVTSMKKQLGECDKANSWYYRSSGCSYAVLDADGTNGSINITIAIDGQTVLPDAKDAPEYFFQVFDAKDAHDLVIFLTMKLVHSDNSNTSLIEESNNAIVTKDTYKHSELELLYPVTRIILERFGKYFCKVEIHEEEDGDPRDFAPDRLFMSFAIDKNKFEDSHYLAVSVQLDRYISVEDCRSAYGTSWCYGSIYEGENFEELLEAIGQNFERYCSVIELPALDPQSQAKHETEAHPNLTNFSHENANELVQFVDRIFESKTITIMSGKFYPVLVAEGRRLEIEIATGEFSKRSIVAELNVFFKDDTSPRFSEHGKTSVVVEDWAILIAILKAFEKRCGQPTVICHPLTATGDFINFEV